MYVNLKSKFYRWGKVFCRKRHSYFMVSRCPTSFTCVTTDTLVSIILSFWFMRFIHFLKTVHLQQLQGCKSKLGMRKGYHLSIKGILEGYLLSQKWSVTGQGVGPWDGASSYKTWLSTPRLIERFSNDLGMKTREQNRNNKRTEIERFDWFIERIQTILDFGWLSERSGEKTSFPKTF